MLRKRVKNIIKLLLLCLVFILIYSKSSLENENVMDVIKKSNTPHGLYSKQGHWTSVSVKAKARFSEIPSTFATIMEPIEQSHHRIRVTKDSISERGRGLLNGVANSPRENVCSILYFWGNLVLYILGILWVNFEGRETIQLSNDENVFPNNIKICRTFIEEWILMITQRYFMLIKKLPYISSNWLSSEDLVKQREATVYYLDASEMERISSFKCLKDSPPVSVLLLSSHGFTYHKEGHFTQCCHCGKQVNLIDFSSHHPSEPRFHASPDCRFVRRGLVEDQSHSQASANHERSLDSNPPSASSNPPSSASNSPSSAFNPPSSDSNSPSSASIQHSSPTFHSPRSLSPNTSIDQLPTSNTTYNDLLPTVTNTSNDLLPTVTNTSNDLLPTVTNTSNELLPTVTNTSNDLLPMATNTSIDPNSLPTTTATNPLHLSPNAPESSSKFGSQVAPDIKDGTTFPWLGSQATGHDDTDKTTFPPHDNCQEKVRSKGQGLSRSPASTNMSRTSLTVQDGPRHHASASDWADNDFKPECLSCLHHPKSTSVPSHRTSCDKPDTIHDSFFPPNRLELWHMPDMMRFQELLNFIVSMANLTVKVKVNYTNHARPEISKSDKCNKTRYGTGFVFTESKYDKATEMMTALNDGKYKAKVKKLRQKMSHPVRSSPNVYFSVQTTQHLIYDDTEASNTEVFFEFVGPGYSQMKTYKAKGKRLILDNVEGNYGTVLVCKTSDPELVQCINDTRRTFATLKEQMPPNVKKSLLGQCFLISHPHSQGKMVSFGQTAIAKYVLCDQGQGQGTHRGRQLKKYFDNKKGATVQDIRETLMYTANTCYGSSGAPVFTCQEIRNRPGNELELQLATWIHLGVEIESGLSCSVMKSYRPELTEKIQKIAEMAPCVTSHSTEHNKLDKRNTSQPPQSVNLTTNQATSAMATPIARSDPKASATATPIDHKTIYASMEARLQTFKQGYTSLCQHTPLELAIEGFYFSGYSDCLKCFCCNIALKNWKEGNDIKVAHKQFSPDCKFLKVHAGNVAPDVDPAMLCEEPTNVKDIIKEIDLLKLEKKKLKARFLCKVCWRYPSTDLFLPCGDIFACEKCSTFLNTCPMCKQTIEATVALFLS